MGRVGGASARFSKIWPKMDFSVYMLDTRRLQLLIGMLVALLEVPTTSVEVPCVRAPLVPYRSYQQECDDFCNYKCSFFNESLGEHGTPQTMTMYRLTPKNTTGIKNKDTGNAPGDITFFLSKKNLVKQCAIDPTSFGCFLDGDDLYGRFIVQVDGLWGPYFECNPANVIGAAGRTQWIDTREFMCGQGCLEPVRGKGCTAAGHQKERNGTFGYGGAMTCHCDGTSRHNKTVGRELTPFGTGGDDDLGPAYWPPQCRWAAARSSGGVALSAPHSCRQVAQVSGIVPHRCGGGEEMVCQRPSRDHLLAGRDARRLHLPRRIRQTGTGATWMASATSPRAAISTFPSTVAHAGRTVPSQL